MGRWQTDEDEKERKIEGERRESLLGLVQAGQITEGHSMLCCKSQQALKYCRPGRLGKMSGCTWPQHLSPILHFLSHHVSLSQPLDLSTTSIAQDMHPLVNVYLCSCATNFISVYVTIISTLEGDWRSLLSDLLQSGHTNFCCVPFCQHGTDLFGTI